MSSRQEIAERVISRWKARGFDFKNDGDFVDILALWIEGSIDMVEMRSRYASVVRRRADERRQAGQDQRRTLVDPDI
jgi:hypothetical protein